METISRVRSVILMLYLLTVFSPPYNALLEILKARLAGALGGGWLCVRLGTHSAYGPCPQYDKQDRLSRSEIPGHTGVLIEARTLLTLYPKVQSSEIQRTESDISNK